MLFKYLYKRRGESKSDLNSRKHTGNKFQNGLLPVFLFCRAAFVLILNSQHILLCADLAIPYLNPQNCSCFTLRALNGPSVCISFLHLDWNCWLTVVPNRMLIIQRRNSEIERSCTTVHNLDLVVYI